MEGPSRQRALLCLSTQEYTCFLCDVCVFPSTAFFRCTIPKTDKYWVRVYGEIGAELAFRRGMRWRAFCGKCAPEGSVQRYTGPSTDEMRHRGPGDVDATVTTWLIENSFSFKKNYTRKKVSAYKKYLMDNETFVNYEQFILEMERLYSF